MKYNVHPMHPAFQNVPVIEAANPEEAVKTALRMLGRSYEGHTFSTFETKQQGRFDVVEAPLGTNYDVYVLSNQRQTFECAACHRRTHTKSGFEHAEGNDFVTCELCGARNKVVGTTGPGPGAKWTVIGLL
jgi:hypothetical protein